MLKQQLATLIVQCPAVRDEAYLTTVLYNVRICHSVR